MKTNKIMILFFALALLMVACKKESAVNNETKIISTDQKLATLANSFLDKVNSPFKSDEILPVDSAVWYMKLAANFTYGNAGVKLEDLSVEKFYLPLNIEGENISIAQTADLYDDVISGVTSHYNGIEAEEKELSFVNVEIDTIFYNEQPSGFQLEVTSAIEKGGYVNPFTFNETDYWWWADGGGKCGPYSGGSGQDAMTQLENKYRYLLPCPSGGYWLPEFIYHEIPESFPATATPNNYCGFYLFRNSIYYEGDFHECLTPAEMNFYLSGVRYVGITLLPQKWGFYGQGYYPIDIDLHSQAFYSGGCPGPGDLETIQHGCYFTYASAHYNPGGGLPLD